jgi:hypothetical protein
MFLYQQTFGSPDHKAKQMGQSNEINKNWKNIQTLSICQILIYFIAKQPSTPCTKEIENLLSTECVVIDLRINPRTIPFFTPLTHAEGDQCMAVYIAPINHNRINSKWLQAS